MTVFPIFLAYLEASSDSNTPGMITLLICSILAIIAVMGISHYDKKNKSKWVNFKVNFLVSMNSTDQKGLVEAVESEYAIKQCLPMVNRQDEEEERERLIE